LKIGKGKLRKLISSLPFFKREMCPGRNTCRNSKDKCVTLTAFQKTKMKNREETRGFQKRFVISKAFGVKRLRTY
jgi:hypothetical protein